MAKKERRYAVDSIRGVLVASAQRKRNEKISLSPITMWRRIKIEKAQQARRDKDGH
jgi:hypothetical protein